MDKSQRAKYLAKCRGRIEAAKKFRQTEGYEKDWERFIDLYRGKHFDKIQNEDRIAVNVSKANVDTIWTSVSNSHPQISINATAPEHADAAIVTEACINYYWRTRPIKQEIQLAEKESLIVGHGWIKTGWRFVEKKQDKHPDALEADYQDRQAQMSEYAAANPDMAASLPTDEEIRAMIPDSEWATVEDGPFVERVSPFDVYVDPEATTMQNVKWIAQRIYKSESEVKNEKSYKSKSRSEAKPDGKADESMVPDGSEKDKANKKCSVWEYYDLRAGTMCIFAGEGGEDFLVDPLDQPYSFGHPFVFVPDYEIPGKFYPIGELEAIQDLQTELNKTRSQMLNHRKRGARKYLYDKRAFSNDAISSLTSDVDGEAIAVNDGIPFAEAIAPMQSTTIDPQLYQWSDTIEGDIDNISGISEYQRGGGNQSIRRSATEASIIADVSNSRAAEKLSRFEAVNAEVARRIVMLMQEYMTNDMSIRITGKDGQPIWGTVEPSFIQGEFDYEVEAGSTKPKNEAYQMQQATQLFSSLAPILPPLIQSGILNMPEFLKFYMEQGFGIKDATKFVNAPQPPQIDPATGQPVQGPPGMPPQGMPPENGGPPPDQGQGQDQGAALQQLVGQVGYPAQGPVPNGQ